MELLLITILCITSLVLIVLVISIIKIQAIQNSTAKLQNSLNKDQEALYRHINIMLEQQQKQHLATQKQNDEQFHSSIKTLQHSLTTGMHDIRLQLQNTMEQNTKHIASELKELIKSNETQLKSISNQVEQRLNDGFEKTTKTFQNVVERLAVIDKAQKEITALSNDVVGLQDILNDKRSRGAFGEVQLNALIKNLMPAHNYKIQATLSNGKRVDCLLILPEPTGSIAIDSKFPLENYKNMLEYKHNELEFNSQAQKFRQAVKKHIDDIASKYIIPGETADGSLLFIPAEAVFAEIHANFYDIVEYAHKHKVWLASPTTMMAILTTSLAAIKDVATKKQVHIIQKHLGLLNLDFGRFQKRMDNLARHIKQADEDVSQIHLSSKKISSRFMQIENVELESTLEEAIQE
jgi:DNA recombination protein RmuC